MFRAATRALAGTGLGLAVLACGAACQGKAARDVNRAPAPKRAAAPGGARVSAPPAPDAGAPIIPVSPEARAAELAQRLLIVDGHIDAPYQLDRTRRADGGLAYDISAHAPRVNFDFERARRGGLDAPFMSIYVPAKYESGGAKRYADGLIDLVVNLTEHAPERFALARSPREVRANSERGKVSLALGMENGSPLERRLENVRHFHARGVRYITLTHSRDNHLADSATDGRRSHGGLSEFGKRAVREMNAAGIMVDVSHISDDAFWQVIEVSRTPVIASHSSCRHFTPGFARNMSDAMIRALAGAGGVILINFGSGFLKARARPRASVEQVADHIDHVRKLVGIGHVGLGSDFDGVGDTLAAGLEDVSSYPNLIRTLLERGYTEPQIEAICSGNVLRVWQAAEDFAARAGAEL